MKAASPRVSERRFCRVVGLNRATVRRVARAPGARPRRVAPELVTRLLRFRQGQRITLDRPEQNGMIERFFRSLKKACVWQHLFPSFAAARDEIAAWIRWYNEARPPRCLQPFLLLSHWAGE